MFKKNQPVKKRPETPPATQVPVLKYQRPKILLIDLDTVAKETLERDGYYVAAGTFGKPYRVPKGSGFVPVVVEATLPNYTEQEIIVLDLVPSEPSSIPPEEKSAPMEELDWWAKCNAGVIDPRARAMAMVQEQFGRIYQNGGTFVIFSDGRDKQELVFARNDKYQGLCIEQKIPYDNWSFLSTLWHLNISDDHGEEITAAKGNSPLLRLLTEHLDGASFCCTIEADRHIEKQWTVLASNKYGSAVAGCLAPPEKSKCGWIFVFPRIRNKAGFLSALLKNVLPDLAPSLFPHAEGQRWVHRPEYELPSVLEKTKEISAIQDAAAMRVSELEKAVDADRNANKFLYDLLRETGADLVAAVQRALTILGFTNIVDVDAEMKKGGKGACLREDLRIHDISPVLVLDVKGVAGKAEDAEALQAQKHAFIYIQEQNRADVRGLTIINHQRLLPPLDRDNDMPFRKEILDNAAQVKLGLMTTWDLFRLVRGFCRHSWTPDQVKPLFYEQGRVFPIPRHYEFVGVVEHVWKNAFSVQIENGTLHVGDRISIAFPVDFDELTITSLHLNDTDVQSAAVGNEVGILRNEASPKVKVGSQVYRIKSAQHG
jgi:hypothetical protein